MVLQELPFDFTVCKLRSVEDALFALSDSFSFLAKTDDEISLTCRTSVVPVGATEREDGWRGLRVAGTLDFSLVGILSKISSLLAKNGIPIYAISTYDTDYIFCKNECFAKAKTALTQAGYEIE